MFTLAQVSDPHLAPLPRPALAELAGKRLLGYLNWLLGRGSIHRRATLDALMADLRSQSPDHIAVTGDLVNLSLRAEFEQAALWLETLGPPDRVSVIPGNHDAYVAMPFDDGIGRWRPYMAPVPTPAAAPPTPAARFPFVRRLGAVALVGLSTAIPTGPFIAAGQLGEDQLAALTSTLRALRREKLFRVVLVHHPPLAGIATPGRALRDAAALQTILEQSGAELVLYGHDHVQAVRFLETADGPLPVVGTPSASCARAGHWTLARYNLFRIGYGPGGWSCEMVGRGLTDGGDGIVETECRLLRTAA